MVHSTWSTSTIEEVARSVPEGLKWYHMYILPDKKENIHRLQLAEKEGYKAIVLTVDAPYRGQKYPTVRSQVRLPPHLSLVNLQSVMKVMRGGATPMFYNPSQTWDAVRWLRSVVCCLKNELF